MENFVEKNTLPFFLLHTNQNRKDGQTHKPNHTNKRPTHIISLCYLRTNERREANDGYFSFQPISVGFLSLFYSLLFKALSNPKTPNLIFSISRVSAPPNFLSQSKNPIEVFPRFPSNCTLSLFFYLSFKSYNFFHS